MGRPDQFAKETFAEETSRITRGAIVWEDPPEIRLTYVQGDGMLRVRNVASIDGLAEPWPQARKHTEVPLEIKMAGEHLGAKPQERILLRRQARQVQRVEEDEDNPWEGHEPIWVVASHVPALLRRRYRVRRFAPGCYRVGPARFEFLWIAANDLPLRDELVPFLVARSGSALDEFARWVAPRRPLDWVLNMIEYTSMSTTVRDELVRKFGKSDDPVIEARRQRILQILLDESPQVKESLIQQGHDRGRKEGRDEGRDEGRVSEARSALRRVLAARKLQVSPEQIARIEACADHAKLERWLERAAVASSAAEALA